MNAILLLPALVLAQTGVQTADPALSLKYINPLKDFIQINDKAYALLPAALVSDGRPTEIHFSSNGQAIAFVRHPNRPAFDANMIVTNEADEKIYLREYFGAPADEYQSARFYLMKQVAHMFYAMAFLSLASSGTLIDWRKPAPAFSDFQRRFWAREVGLADNHEKIVFARVHLEQLLSNAQKARFDEALKIVADQHA